MAGFDNVENSGNLFSGGQCSRPVTLPSGDTVRCGSRVKSRCASCAELCRSDWAAIARSGVFDDDAFRYKFYLLTLTAPSFGAVHRVPCEGAGGVGCRCGAVHSVADADLRGVPIDVDSYDYLGQVAWNRDSGVLWDNTRKRLRDRWSSLEYFMVREWQDRGVLHVHVIVRIARFEAPTAIVLSESARSAVAFSKVDGSLVAWGEQFQCDSFPVDGAGAKAIWYLSKALNYVLKDVVKVGDEVRLRVWQHQAKLVSAARAMKCGHDCMGVNCVKAIHNRYGSRSHVVSASRKTRTRSGWSFAGLTRKLQRLRRLQWVLQRLATAEHSVNIVKLPELFCITEVFKNLNKLVL